MDQDWVILRLSPDLLASLRALAREARVTPGQYLRDHITRQASPARDVGRFSTKLGVNVAALRETISDILFSARDWAGLQSALMEEGFALRVQGYGLMLCAWPSNDPVCKSAELGFSYADLLRRLGGGAPPLPETLVVDRTEPEAIPVAS